MGTADYFLRALQLDECLQGCSQVLAEFTAVDYCGFADVALAVRALGVVLAHPLLDALLAVKLGAVGADVRHLSLLAA